MSTKKDLLALTPLHSGLWGFHLRVGNLGSIASVADGVESIGRR